MPKEEQPSVCNHENKHAFNADGKLESLFCDLPKGHGGDHHAKYTRNQAERTTNEKGIVVKVEQKPVDEDAYWNDAAGTPVNEIKEGKVEQLTEYQHDLVMDVLKRNPNLTAKQAIAAAKELEAWR